MDRGMILEGGTGTLADGRPATPTRVESIGSKVPVRILTTEELMKSTRHRTHIELERLTGVHQRHVCSEGEDSFTLAVGAARDCLAHSRYGPQDIEMLISTTRWSRSAVPSAAGSCINGSRHSVSRSRMRSAHIARSTSTFRTRVQE